MEHPDDELPVRAGELVADKYRVERLVGRGGMGCVVEATHLQLLQRVAIKFVIGENAGDLDASKRLLREARAASALRSEHVARVLDVGTLADDTPYLVMEYLEGTTLHERIKTEGRLPVEESLRIATETCRGLAEAHRRGIIHRDVKPANIFLARMEDGRVVAKLLDFGIAKVADPGMAVESNLTSSEHALGTPRYMSPEQLRSTSTVDARTDVWSLGVVLYECLAGRSPFATGSAYEVGARILVDAVVPLRSLRDDVPAELEALVARCLEKDPALRFADAGELVRALDPSGPRSGASSDRAILPAAPAAPAVSAAPAPAPGPSTMPATRVQPAVAPRPVVVPEVAPVPVHANVSASAMGLESKSWRMTAFAVGLAATLGSVVIVLAFTARRPPSRSSGPPGDSALTPVAMSAAPSSVAPSPLDEGPPVGNTSGSIIAPGPPPETPSPKPAPVPAPPSPTKRAPVAPAKPMTRPPNER